MKRCTAMLSKGSWYEKRNDETFTRFGSIYNVKIGGLPWIVDTLFPERGTNNGSDARLDFCSFQKKCVCLLLLLSQIFICVRIWLFW